MGPPAGACQGRGGHEAVTPFGAMPAGIVANALGAPMSMILGGCLCVLGALVIVARFRAMQKVRCSENDRAGVVLGRG